MATKRNLVRSFALRSLIVFMATSAVLGWVVTLQVREAVVAEAGHSASVIANAVVRNHLGDAGFEGTISAEQAASLDRLLENGLESSGVFAIKIWDADARLVYSSDGNDQIGAVHAEDNELVEALDGHVETEIALSAEAENQNQYAEHGSLLEVYAPILGDMGVPGGVFELYLPYAPVQAQIRDSSLQIWAIVLAGALVTYAVQIRIVRRAARRLDETEEHVATIEARLQRSAGRIEDHSLGTLAGLINAVDAKDSYTADHSVAVAEYSTAMGVHLDLNADERRLLERAALLHDVGKIGIPEAVLLKPARLDEAEREIVKDHSQMGARIVEAIPFLEEIVPIVRHHHEHWDGNGYPDGLWGEQIPRFARILAVADAFDAMTSDRPYRDALSVETALEELERHRGTQFDPAAVDALVSAVGSGSVEPAPAPVEVAIATT